MPLICLSLMGLELVFFFLYGPSVALTIALFITMVGCWFLNQWIQKKLVRDVRIEEAILKSARVSIIATDVDGMITHFSKGAEDLLGYQSYEMVGKQTPAILHDLDEVIERNKELNEEFNEENTPGFITFVRRVYRDDKDEREWTYIRKDGTRLPVILSVTPIYDRKNTIEGFLGVATSIFDLRTQTENLVKAKEEAMLANRSKSFFLANMSHELRTPLNGVIGMSELLNETQLNSDQKSLNKYILESSKQLGLIINDILDYTKIEMGGISIKYSPTNMELFNKSIEKIQASLNKTTSIQSEFTVEGEIPECLEIDSTRLTQVLTNLISNAFKFTKEGVVSVRCAYVDGKILYRIEDTGIGIDDDKLTHLFSAFTQESEHMRREFIGTGLGLSIVRELIQLMDGRISVDSKSELGSKFVVSVPADIAQSTQEEVEELIEFNFDGVKILLVEDNHINQKLIVKTLENVGATVDVVINGRDAVNQVAEVSYDLVLMDYQLPIMDGVTATKLIREFNADVPIIALTANAFEEDKRDCLLAGMNDFLAKPISPLNLKKAIHKFL